MLLVNASVQETLWMDAPFSAFLPSPAEEFSCCFALVDRGLYKNNFTALSFKLQIHKGVAIQKNLACFKKDIFDVQMNLLNMQP